MSGADRAAAWQTPGVLEGLAEEARLLVALDRDVSPDRVKVGLVFEAREGKVGIRIDVHVDGVPDAAGEKLVAELVALAQLMAIGALDRAEVERRLCAVRLARELVRP